MTGKYRKPIILFAIVLLAALNIWRWWPAEYLLSENAGGTTGSFSVEDFEVKAFSVDSLPPLSRNIFYPKKVDAVKPRVMASPQIAQPVLIKNPEEVARDNAQAEFSQIQCVGISIRNEKVNAYVISAGQPFLVSQGDKVGGRFVVEKIVPDGVSLRDPETGVGGLITVSGKK